MICPNCKVIIPESVDYCLKCNFPVNANEQSERTIKEEKIKEMLICPKCGALHTPTAKVCRNDGTILLRNEDSKEVNLHTDGKEKKKAIVKRIILFSLIVIFFITLSYIYLSNRVLNATKKITLNSEGSIVEKKDERIDLSKEKAFLSPAFIEVEINRRLRKNGVEGVYVEVGEDFIATVTGYFLTKLDRLKTFSVIESYKEISSIIDNTKKNLQKGHRISASDLKNEIIESLKNEGLSNLSVEVDSSLNVTIKGAVRSKEEKNKAFEIAKNFKDVRIIKDLIFIVEH
jgi:ribosomal protein L40E